MNELLATIITGMVTDENEVAYFVQKNGVTFRLPKSEGEHQLGESVTGFAYRNQRHENALTTEIPKSRQGHYAFATVIASRRDLGVFVDIGLPDKEIAVSLDELPTLTELWPKKGDRLLVALRVDQKGRIWGTLAEEKVFRSMSKKGREEQKNQNITGTVFRLKIAGTYILTEDFYLGFIHPSERYGVLNVSLKPRAYEAIGDDAEMILAYLRRAKENKMPYTDKSEPEAIKEMFGISKGQFKRAMGHLLKAKLVEQKEGFTYLIEKTDLV